MARCRRPWKWIQKQALVGMSKDQLGAAWGLPIDIRKERRGRRYCYTEDCSRFARVMGDVVVEVSQQPLFAPDLQRVDSRAIFIRELERR